jgi:hypothetical protein
MRAPHELFCDIYLDTRRYRGAMPVGGGWALRSRGQPERLAGGVPTAGGRTRTPPRSPAAISPTRIKACQHQPLVVGGRSFTQPFSVEPLEICYPC